MTTAPKIPHAAPLPPDLLSPEDLQSLPPEKLQPAPDVIETPPLSLGRRAALSIRSMADTDLRELMSSARGNKRRALMVALAFPVVIGLVLVVIGGGEGTIDAPAQPMLMAPISTGDNIRIRLTREAAELEKIRAELAAASAKPKAEKSPHRKHR